MLRNLLLGTAAVALAAFATPARAQLLPGDVEIEGPMSAVEVYQPGDPRITDVTSQGNRTSIGQLNVLGVTVKVLEGALIHTPTNTTSVTLADFAASAPRLPGRTTGGFIGGTAIVVGESINGQVYANDVFSDLFEHVVVGEATNPVTTATGVTRATVNGMIIRRSTDRRMPASPAINGFGLRINADAIDPGTLVAAEGYFVPAQKTLYYHTIETDGAPLANPNTTQVGILRADCRIRGGGRDEIEVRGGVVNPANATVQIQIPNPTPANPNRFTTIGLVTATPDPTTTPPQGLFRANFRTLTIPGGVCPTLVRAVIPAGGAGVRNQATATADMEGR
jgi:hypothetical protein